jgi:hypothetical protein
MAAVVERRWQSKINGMDNIFISVDDGVGDSAG